MSEEKRSFQAEVSRLLHLMVNAVYADKEVFLRELISNASDACDKLRYLALTDLALTADAADFEIAITADPKARTITVADNGIGMDRDDLINLLGTIARSGTGAFVSEMTGDARKDAALIGQFGVGFYSVFMVADRVEVTSRKAGGDAAWRWESDGLGEYTVAEAERETRGTDVVVHLRKDEDEWLAPYRLTEIIKTYSDHIALPITLDTGQGPERANAASAIWARPKSEIGEEQYKEFYHHVGHAGDEPWLTVHVKAEGKVEYAMLLFVPTQRPFDLFDPARQHRVKLYVKRVFITDDCEGLVPPYLRFLRGVVDAEDLPLNISREMLQSTPLVKHLRQAIVKRVLTELQKKAEKDADGYATFWKNFGPVLKEGLYEDAERRDELLSLTRFHSTHNDGGAGDELVSLADYVGRMKEGQEAIYTISGDDLGSLRKSPQLEGFRARGVEVLLLTDPVDDFWMATVPDYEKKPFRSVTRGSADLSKLGKAEDAPAEDDDARPADVATLIAVLKQHLADAVKDVRQSERLTDSAVCLVADEGALDMHLERMLKAHGQLDKASSRILEINPRHELIKALVARAKESGAADALADAAHLLLDQARIVEGDPVPDPAAFAQRLANVMAKGLAA